MPNHSKQIDIWVPEWVSKWLRNRADTKKLQVALNRVDLAGDDSLTLLLNSVKLTSKPYLSTTGYPCMTYILTLDGLTRQWDVICSSDAEEDFFKNVKQYKLDMLRAVGKYE